MCSHSRWRMRGDALWRPTTRSWPSSTGIETLALEESVIWSSGTPASSTRRTASSGSMPVTLPERLLRLALKSRVPPVHVGRHDLADGEADVVEHDPRWAGKAAPRHGYPRSG